MEKRLTLEREDVEYLIEYLSLLIDDGDCIDKEYRDTGYKVYGHIKQIIKEMKDSLSG